MLETQLRPCPGCGEELSAYVNKCPKCGMHTHKRRHVNHAAGESLKLAIRLSIVGSLILGIIVLLAWLFTL